MQHPKFKLQVRHALLHRTHKEQKRYITHTNPNHYLIDWGIPYEIKGFPHMYIHSISIVSLYLNGWKWKWVWQWVGWGNSIIIQFQNPSDQLLTLGWPPLHKSSLWTTVAATLVATVCSGALPHCLQGLWERAFVLHTWTMDNLKLYSDKIAIATLHVTCLSGSQKLCNHLSGLWSVLPWKACP